MEQTGTNLVMALVAYAGVFIVLGVLVIIIKGLRLVEFPASRKGDKD